MQLRSEHYQASSSLFYRNKPVVLTGYQKHILHLVQMMGPWAPTATVAMTVAAQHQARLSLEGRVMIAVSAMEALEGKNLLEFSATTEEHEVPHFCRLTGKGRGMIS